MALEMIRVVIAEDHALVRTSLGELLGVAGDIDVVGLAADGSEAVRLARSERPDVVLVDLSMRGMSPVEATRRIVAVHAGARVLAMASPWSSRRIVSVLDAGAVGCLLKDADPDELFRGIRAAARGALPLSP